MRNKFKAVLIIATALLFYGGCTNTEEEADESSGTTCTYSSENVKGESSINSGSKTVKYGYLQVSANDQNPIVALFENGEQVFCNKGIDTSPVDSKVLTAAYDATLGLFVAISVDGGSNESGYISRYTKSGWLSSYGSGGGSKVTVLLKINTTTGEPEAGTFIRAKLSNGKTNSLEATAINFASGSVKVTANSWYSPLKADKSTYNCSGGSSPFTYTVTLNASLSDASATTASSPCS